MRSSAACTLALTAGLVLGLGSTAQAQRKIEMVYGNAAQLPAGDPRGAVPGTLAGSADPRFSNFSEMNRTPDGFRWVTLATTNATPNTQDQVVLWGAGKTGAVLVQEGVTQINPGDPTPEYLNIGTSIVTAPRVTDDGRYALGFRLAVPSANAIHDRLVTWNGSAFSVIKANDAMPVSAGGGTWGGNFNSVAITTAGTVTFMANELPNSASMDSVFTDNGAAKRIDIGVTVPGNQLTGDTATWTDVDTNTYMTDFSGTRYIALGEVGTATATDKVAVVDGNVVVQEGFPVAGVPGNLSGISTVRMEANGDYYIRGTSTTTGVPAVSTAWVMRNGVVIAKVGDPLFPGSTENWKTFRDVKGDNCGNYVINGTTDIVDALGAPDTLKDEVLVYNGGRVLARESDPVDVNGDGMDNDGLYMHLFQDRGVVLEDDYFYFGWRLKSSPTATTNAANSNTSSLLRARLCKADWDFNGSVSLDDIFIFINAWFARDPRANFYCNTPLDIDDIFVYINGWFAGC